MSTASAAPITTSSSRARKHWPFAVALLVIAVLALPVAWLYFEAQRSLPQVDGSVEIAGLSAPVEVLRDAQGAPHIRAQDMQDLLFAQGYVTAQDRLWQMDITRRVAAGELAEILGPDLIKHDRQQRLLSLRQVAERSAQRLDAKQAELLQAYVNGVNAFIATHRDRLPLEFHILGYSPKPWRMEDSFLVGGNMAQTLSHYQFAAKLWRERLSKLLPGELAAGLYPNSSWRDHPPALEMKAQPTPAAEQNDDDSPSSDPDTNVVRLLPWLSENGERSFRAGSNNWVVSGAHTVTGKPLLSNDMHLHHQIPGVWYEVQLTAGDFDVAGVTLPGLPFVIAGHNQRIAWGFTNLGPDVEDVFVESFNGKGEYQTPAGLKQPEVRDETIHVKGSADVHMRVLTTRHGPIVTELQPGETRKIALKWSIYDVGLSFPFGEINAAHDWKEFRAAFSKFTAPGQNAVFADVDGNIGYQATGFVPIRVSGDGSLPVDGATDEHEWKGYIPFDQMPSVYDPPSGMLATANGKVTPQGYAYAVSSEWSAPYRTERIYRVLESGRKFAAADMLALETDIYSDFDHLCAEKFAQAVERSPQASARARAAADLLRSWDGRMSKDSAAATIEALAQQRLKRLLLEPRLGALWKEYDWEEDPVWMENIVTQRPQTWLPSKYKDYDALLLAAVEGTVNGGAAPRRLSSWSYGKEFPLLIEHPLLSKIPLLSHFAGPGQVAQSGGSWTVKQVGRSFGPSERMTIDLADLDHSTLDLVTGESGEFLSRHYMDQWRAWYEGTTFAFPFSKQAVQAATVDTLRLLPKN